MQNSLFQHARFSTLFKREGATILEHNSSQAELKGKILNGRISLIYRVDGYE